MVVDNMKYKKAKKIVIEYFNSGVNRMVDVDFGWKFRIYPKLRRQIKGWAEQVEAGE